MKNGPFNMSIVCSLALQGLYLLTANNAWGYIAWGFIALAIICRQVTEIPIRGRMTPEKAQRIKPYIDLLKKYCAAKDIEGYDTCLQDIRRIENEPA